MYFVKLRKDDDLAFISWYNDYSLNKGRNSQSALWDIDCNYVTLVLPNQLGGFTMVTMNLKVGELRKLKGVSQQSLADYLGVSFQSVSKWETGVAMPDITLLPSLAEYFDVTVDELLGLKPLKNQQYIPRDTDNRDNWKDTPNFLKNRQFFWNQDYLKFLVQDVFKITQPVNIIEFRCADADLGKRLMPLLPKGSTYTGIDSGFFLEKARENLAEAYYEVLLEESDLYSFQTKKKYDLAICQAALRHLNRPIDILHKMKDCVKSGGFVACVEVDREIENIGLYIDGMDYEALCTSFDWRSLWRKEKECEGRDYAIGIRAPFYMSNIGLSQIQVRMNDCVNYITPECENYEQLKQEFACYRGWDHEMDESNREQTIKFYMSRGIERAEVERLIKFQDTMTRAFHDQQKQLSFLNIIGLIITCGRK